MKLVILAAVATSVLAAVMVTKLMATNVDEPEGAVSLSEIPGVWRSEGYNDVVEITDDGVVQYHISGSHCVRIDPKSSASRIDVAAQPHVLINDDRSRFATDPTVNSETWHSYYFSRLDALPDLCADGGTATTSDPLALFDAAWHSIEENYAFFDVRDVDWEAERERFRPLFAKARTERETWHLFEDLLTVFGDGHVSLTDPAGSTANILPASPTWLRLRDTLVARATPERLRREFEEQDRFSDESRFIAHRTERYIRRLTRDWTKEILPGYLERGRLRREANDKVAWGRLGDNLGYLAVFEMEGLSGKGRVVRDLRNLDRALDKALDDLADTDALVLDIRLNGGGYDVVSQAIAARFIDNPKVTLRKTARRGSGSAPMAEHLSEPAERIGYRKPVYLLISGLTASAAEVLALMLKDLPHVTLIGEPTEGIFSDIMTVQLPNDWILGLSNEVYTDADATPYEGRGVPPDHAALLFDPQFHEAGRDAALERVFALHAERRSARAD